MMKKILAGMVITVLMAGAATAQEERSKQASMRLKEAWALKKTSYKKEEDVKRGILLNTVACYESLVDEFSECKAECAEACFRMGEIHRSLKMVAEAESDFNRVFSFDKEGEFAARSLKEIGHIYRRQKAYDKAIAYYQRVLNECPAQRDTCADAHTWIGKVHLKNKEFGKARAMFLGFVEAFPEFPVDAVRNIDLAAGTLLDEGRSDEAAALVKKWRQHFESMLGKDKRTDRKIEKALERMKTPEKLK